MWESYFYPTIFRGGLASTTALTSSSVEAVDEQRGIIEEITLLFQGHSSSMYKLLRQRRERHDLTPLPHGAARVRSWRRRQV
jgi:glycine cleavage system regulatory protein